MVGWLVCDFCFKLGLILVSVRKTRWLECFYLRDGVTPLCLSGNSNDDELHELWIKLLCGCAMWKDMG